MVEDQVLVFKVFPKDRAQQRFLVQKTSTLQFPTVVEEVLVEVFKASPRDRAQQRFVVLKMSTLQFLTVVEEVLVEVFMVFPKDRAQQRFVVQKTSTLLFLTVVEEALPGTGLNSGYVEQNMLSLLFLTVEVFKASPRDRALQRYVPVPHGRVGKRGLHGFPPRTEFHSVCH